MASKAREVQVVGAGLAGLATGLSARAHGAKVRLDEAGRLPRHRVCGEFMAGLDRATVQALDLETVLRDAPRLSRVAWFHRSRLLREDSLPVPAIGISRHQLDATLAARLQAAGGEIHFDRRVHPLRAGPGTVWATGRHPATQAVWLGLKLHLLEAPADFAADLEVHLGDQAYVGLSRIEDGRINVTGLFRRRAGMQGSPASLLLGYLHAAGLSEVAQRVAASPCDPASACAVAGLAYRGPFLAAPGESLALGDRATLIPPFTGHGMALALEAGARAGPVLAAWARGELSWPAATRQINALLADQRRRQRWARVLHPFLLHRSAQSVLAAWASRPAFPFGLLYRLTHGPAHS